MKIDPLRPHAHEPNPEPPSADPSFELTALGDTNRSTVSVDGLLGLLQTTLTDCYIVSTGHGSSGPFVFRGPTLLALIQANLSADSTWSQVEVISADGFGTRLMADELHTPDPAGPIILAISMDGQPLTRQQGLIRLIVPSETDDALRQVKWVGQVNIK